jgi:hypothetical protein
VHNEWASAQRMSANKLGGNDSAMTASAPIDASITGPSTTGVFTNRSNSSGLDALHGVLRPQIIGKRDLLSRCVFAKCKL